MAEEMEESKPKKKSKLPLILMAVVFVVLLAGGIVAFMMLSGGGQSAQTEEMAEEGGAAVSTETGTMIDFPMFIVNLTNAGAQRYLKIALTVEVPSDNKDLPMEIEAKMPQLKDTMITVLSSKALEEISTQQGKISLKQELLRRINAVLGSGKLKDLYFTEFVIQ